jgi:intein/homing endonuclease
MPRKHYANALVSRQNVPFDEWMEVLRGQNEGAVPRDHVHRIAKTVLRKCDPRQYLLSHATIVASVDTYEPKGSKTGRLMNRGVQIDVRYPDFRIKPNCLNIINNNGDAWSRSLLLSTYRTFIGAPNYLEHIQIPELSKGFIVDAIARDLGHSCYIDILVATDKKHRQLVDDILKGDLNALSMGCFVAGSQVTMSDGTLLPIEEIRPEMTVLTQKGNSCRVDNLQIRENRWSMRRIKVSGLAPIEATDNHKFYKVPSSEVITKRSYGRTLVVEQDYNWEYCEAKDLRVGDIVATPIPNSIVQPSVSLEEARLLGHYIGDGWKFENKHDSTVGVGICCDSKHSDISNWVENAMNHMAWKAKELNNVVNSRSVPNLVSKSVRRGADYLISTSRAVRHLIDSHVNGRRALDKSIGQEAMNWPIDHQLSLLAGIIDSDGCVSTRKNGTSQVYISTRNLNLANQYVTLLARCGIIGTVYKAKRNGTKMLPNASGIDYQVRIRNDKSHLIPSIKIQSLKDKIKYTPGNSDRWITNSYLYSKIKKIETFEHTGYVYDLQVDNDHSYVVNGVGVSNCISMFTICSKCGNVAADDTQLCPCIQYEGKHTEFTDESGEKQKIAELIGHVSVPNSNQFIEASWVKNPAFAGAVRRNFLNQDLLKVAAKMDEAGQIYELRKSEINLDGMKRAASYRYADQDDPASQEPSDQMPQLDQGGGEEPEELADSQQAAPQQQSEGKKPDVPDEKIDSLLEKIQEQLLSVIMDKLSEKLEPKPEDIGTVMPAPVDLTSGNDNIITSSEDFSRLVRKEFSHAPKLVKWAEQTYKTVHEGGIKSIRKASLQPKDLVILSWIIDRVKGRRFASHLYHLAMQVGPSSSYPSEKSYLAACSLKMGRDLSTKEKSFFKAKGRIASVASF